MFTLIAPKLTCNSRLVNWIFSLPGGLTVTVTLIKMGVTPIRHRKAGISTVTHDHTMTLCHYLLMMVRGMDSHMSPHDCGRGKKQRCFEMEPSSCWGNWDRKWGSVWGHGVQTQQSEDFVFPTIPYSPTRSCCHTLTHMNAHTSKPTTPPGPLSPGGESVISTNLFQPPP